MNKVARKIYVLILFLFSIFVVAGCAQDNNKIEDVFNNLFENVNLSAIDSNLSFPKSVNGVNITYESNKSNIITNDGRVNRQIEDATVEVNITLNDGKNEVLKKVTIIVKKINSKIITVYNNLFKDYDINNIEGHLEFLAEVDGVEITYQSNKPEILNNNGQVVRGENDEQVKVIITLKYEGEEYSQEVTLTILKEEENPITEVADNLLKSYNLNEIISDITLPTLDSGVLITWSSSNENVISPTGKVTRTYKDEIVTLNATISFNGVTIYRSHIIKVLKDKSKYLEQVFNELFDFDLTKIDSDLNFVPETNGILLTYESSNLNVLSNDGKITQQGIDTQVNLKVTLNYEGSTLSKTIVITVLKNKTTYINEVFNRLFTTDLTKITENINFITSLDGVNIDYNSENPNVISSTGVINRGGEDVQVKVYIKLSYEGIIVIKEVMMTVLKVEVNSYPISRALTASANEIVTVEGVIIGIVGTSVYINDGENGIYLYGFGSGYATGNLIRATGTKTTYNGLIQLQNIKNIVKLDTNIPLPEAKNITSLSQINVQSDLYSIENLIITDIDVIKTGADSFIDLKDSNNNTMQIIISKHIDAQTVYEIINKLGDVMVGDKLNLTNIISGYYKKYQFQLTSASQIEVKYANDDPVVTNPIEPYYPDSRDMHFLVDELESHLTAGIVPTKPANVLIIPINFTDYIISNNDLARLEKAFFGTSEETGWESVKSYYNKSSYGKFDFNGTILAPFNTNQPSTYYAKKFNNGQDADYEIIKAALNYYDPYIDYSQYDNNDDGYIDGLYFIYATPVWYGDDNNSDNDSDLWWAYVYQYYTENYEFYDGVEANYYLWAGVEFMDEAFTYTEYDDEYISINAATYIHETGHMLGLYDYYDYEVEVGPKGGLGGADMMDYTVGDHNSFSKIMLDWVTPLVVSGKSTTVTLNSFTETGQVVLVSMDWNNTYFDEYFLIEFYTPTGLNEAHVGFNGLYTESGIRIFHVNAQINPDQSNGEVFLYNNSDTAYKVLKPIEADYDNSIEETGIAENSDLFQVGDDFGLSKGYRLSDKSLVNFEIKVLEINNANAKIEIIFN